MSYMKLWVSTNLVSFLTFSLVFIVNPFFLLWSFFFSRKLCFLRSLYLLLIAESISLDTSSKPAVNFFWKLLLPLEWYCQSYLINLIQLIDGWKADDEFSWNNFYFIFAFDMAKNIRRFLDNLFEYYYLNIIVNVNFFSDLKFEYYCEYYPLKYCCR